MATLPKMVQVKIKDKPFSEMEIIPMYPGTNPNRLPVKKAS